MMELFLFLAQKSWDFWTSSIPLIISLSYYFIFKVSPKVTLITLCLNLFNSIFFWVQLQDLGFALYQLFPYLCAFAVSISAYLVEKRTETTSESHTDKNEEKEDVEN